ncbi:hypothetical protein V4F39_19440 [Aquincola sp. MAHUQ-54]|uniref:DUF3883 domain-containing protein n=1 Tax=Aquincola agrisoli TaxID=3119538 RepID=A0AAW9QL46_9BURK
MTSRPTDVATAGRTALKQADDDVAGWLHGIVTGDGSATSQVIVSGVLSVVPGVGQAMDARDLVRGVLTLHAQPASADAWLGMTVTLVGLVPGFGDAFKTAFKLLRGGQPLGRVLDGVSPTLRGNVERWLRSADWAALATQLTRLFDTVVGRFITALDGRITQAVAGRVAAQQVVASLEALRADAPGAIGRALGELQALQSRALADALPRSTHAIAPPGHRPLAAPPQQAASRALASDTTSAQRRHGGDAGARPLPPNHTHQAERREDRLKHWYSGVLAEQLTDYYVFQRLKNLKINELGRKREANDPPRGQGIDHVWRRTGSGPGTHRYIVGETKGRLAGQFAFLAEMNLARMPYPAHRSLGGSRVVDDDNALRGRHADGRLMRHADGSPTRGLNETQSKGTQMSHKWIAISLEREEISSTADKSALQKLIEQAEDTNFHSAAWDRWICLVTAKQMSQHERGKGLRHQLQPPIVVIPDHLLKR